MESTRSLGPNSRALPIHAKTGREWEPDCARSLHGPRDDDFVRFEVLIPPNCTYPGYEDSAGPNASQKETHLPRSLNSPNSKRK